MALPIQKPQIRDIPVSSLKPAPYNPRRIDDAALAALTKSLERFGYVEPVIWNQRTGYVVGGHQRLKVLKAQKVESVPVVVVELSETDERALNVALNSPHLTGEFTDSLQELLAEIQGADDILFNELRLDQLLSDISEARGDADAVPSLPQEPKTRVGDLYEIGNHRLLCGDSTNSADVRRLLGSDRVESMVTDPPYGVDYSSKNEFLNQFDKGNRIQAPIANDAGSDYRAWFASFLALVPWADYATFFVFMSNQEVHNLRLAIDDCHLTWGDYLVWVKNNHVLGRRDYQSRHEFIVYGWPKRHRFFADGHRTTILEYARPQSSELHPTMKPVDLVRQLVEDGSPGGGIVYEPFCGSGTTLLACEGAGRQCRAIELDPLYCDVIVQRWEEYTGRKAVLHRGNG